MEVEMETYTVHLGGLAHEVRLPKADWTFHAYHSDLALAVCPPGRQLPIRIKCDLGEITCVEVCPDSLTFDERMTWMGAKGIGRG